eukprot:m.90895 g.90895  ORF g.90895 m.90895 type:complete len:274 (+) comp11895_c0_seq4:189-1010(+)
MPLVTICGFPSSGKSTIADQIAKAAEQAGMEVVVVRDTDLGLDPREYSASAALEKPARAALKAATERKVSQSTLVILDGPNYIKGYRYELYCIARSLKTPSCVVHVATSVDTSVQRNAARETPYSDEIFHGLVARFEFPDDRQRWDRPLFTIVEDEEVPMKEILAALSSSDVKAPNAATQSIPLASANTVHEIERVSQVIITALVQAQTTAIPGDKVAVPETSERIHLVRKVTMSELRRIRRQFTTYTKTHPIEDASTVGSLFVQFLNQTLQA